jgi:gentisate 1,2-dioxygenase
VSLDVSYVLPGPTQALREAAPAYASGGIVPTRLGERSRARFPLLRYDWTRTRATLDALARERRDAPVEVAYVNPETGGDSLATLGFSALLLRPGEERTLPRMSAARVLHAVEGSGEAQVGGTTLRFDTADTFCAPGFAATRLANPSGRTPLALICADEAPIHRKLGVLEVRTGEASALPGDGE